MFLKLRTTLAILAIALLCPAAHPQQPPQQVIQTGALNAPTAVLTQAGQWSNLISVLSNADQDIFIEDPSADTWLAHNAVGFLDRGQYTLTFVAFYKTVHACRADQVRAGFSDPGDLQACDNYRYRIRQIAVDSPENSVTLLFSAMVFTGGNIDANSVHRETRTRGFTELGPDAQKAISDATKLVAQQSRIYAARQH